jgi:hypothetical protein
MSAGLKVLFERSGNTDPTLTMSNLMVSRAASTMAG